MRSKKQCVFFQVSSRRVSYSLLSMNEQPCKCPDCDFRTSDSASLTRHRKRRHRYDPKAHKSRTVSTSSTRSRSRKGPSTPLPIMPSASFEFDDVFSTPGLPSPLSSAVSEHSDSLMSDRDAALGGRQVPADSMFTHHATPQLHTPTESAEHAFAACDQYGLPVSYTTSEPSVFWKPIIEGFLASPHSHSIVPAHFLRASGFWNLVESKLSNSAYKYSTPAWGCGPTLGGLSQQVAELAIWDDDISVPWNMMTYFSGIVAQAVEIYYDATIIEAVEISTQYLESMTPSSVNDYYLNPSYYHEAYQPATEHHLGMPRETADFDIAPVSESYSPNWSSCENASTNPFDSLFSLDDMPMMQFV